MKCAGFNIFSFSHLNEMDSHNINFISIFLSVILSIIHFHSLGNVDENCRKECGDVTGVPVGRRVRY